MSEYILPSTDGRGGGEVKGATKELWRELQKEYKAVGLYLKFKVNSKLLLRQAWTKVQTLYHIALTSNSN